MTAPSIVTRITRFLYWNYLNEHDNGITNFHFEIAADLLTDRQLAVLKNMRPGLIQLEIGVQSTNETALKAINRRMDIRKLQKNGRCYTQF